MKTNILSILLVILLFSCSKQITKPKLIVFISIDQMKYDYLVKYKQYYKGAFKEINENSILFSNAIHDHAATETSPGHSVLLTGFTPSHTGIIANELTDKTSRKDFYSIQDTLTSIVGGNSKDLRVSPKALKVKTIGEILKENAPESKVFAISGKDRAAILMAGHKANGVFWYQKKTGQLVSSSYYTKDLPTYIETLNNKNFMGQYFAKAWVHFNSSFDYDKIVGDDIVDSEEKHFNGYFPYVLMTDTAINSDFYSQMRYTPFLDTYILEGSNDIFENEKLGQNNETDMLIVGLSALDYIGHSAGPESQEIFDVLLRLDYSIDQLMQKIYKKVKKEDVLFVLSADHGVVSLPEISLKNGLESFRITKEVLDSAIEQVNKNVKTKYSLAADIFLPNTNGLDYNPNINLTQEIKLYTISELKKIHFLKDVFSADELADPNTASRPKLSEFKNSFNKELSPDLQLLSQELNYWSTYSSRGTGHGTPYMHDMHVPIMFYNPGLGHNIDARRVRTVDIAPTILNLLNIRVTEQMDGVSLF